LGNGNLSNSENQKNARAKRKPAHNALQYSVDKMLNERNKLIVENNKSFLQTNNNNNSSNNNNNSNSYNGNLVINSNHQSATNNFFSADKLKFPDNIMNVIKNGQLSPSTGQKLSQITLSKCLSNEANSNGNKLANGTGSTVKTERLSPPMNDLSMYR
jgi:hypothetical protein